MSERVLVVDPPGQEEHETPAGHPESGARVDAVRRGIAAVSGLEVVDGRSASVGELTRVHAASYVAMVRELSAQGGGWLDDDTWVSPGTYGAARRAAGAGLSAIERLSQTDPPAAAFVVTKPPGHHAGRAAGRGFCVFNNVALAAAHLVDTGAKVLVLDWDAHHGDGTQEILWNDEGVLFVSLHQESHYPGTGQPHERGPLRRGPTVVNLPLPAGATGDHYLELMDTVVAPIAAGFRPDWVLVSCGFDAHREDPLADMALTASDFGLLAGRAQALAPAAGRLVLFFEGGYDPDALAASTAAVLSTLSGTGGPEAVASSGGPGSVRVDELRRLLAPG